MEDDKEKKPVEPVDDFDYKAEVEKRVEQEKKFFKNATNEDGSIKRAFIYKCLRQNQLGDGLIFSKLFFDKFTYNHRLKVWMIFKEHSWKIDILKESLTAVEDVAAVYSTEAKRTWKDLTLAIKKGRPEALIKKLEKKIEALNKRVSRLLSDLGRINALKYALTLKNPLACSGDDFNLDPFLLACKNGVVDLRTGILRPGKPEDKISKTTNINCPDDINDEPVQILKFLSEITEDCFGNKRPEWVDFLQRLLGSTLIGKRKERIFILFGGARGQNGKGTIKDLMIHTLGELAWPIPAEMLLDQKFTKSPGGPNPEVMLLVGTRFAVASETNEGKRFSGATVKLYSGGDPYTARNPYGEMKKYWPSHTLFLLTNNLPHHTAEDRAFWQRMIKLSFEWSYVRDPIDKYERKADFDLWEKLVKEDSKFLGWLMRGAVIYQEEGLNVPESIQIEGLKYQREEDDLTDFLLEHFKIEPGARVGASDAFHLYETWYHDNINAGYDPTQPNFGKKMKARFESKKQGIYYYFGLRLREEGEKRDKDILADKMDALDKEKNNSPSNNNKENP